MIKRAKKVNVKIQILALYKKKETKTINVPYQYYLEIFTNRGTTHTFPIELNTVVGLVENGIGIEKLFDEK
jgi:hypothetical protein